MQIKAVNDKVRLKRTGTFSDGSPRDSEWELDIDEVLDLLGDRCEIAGVKTQRYYAADFLVEAFHTAKHNAQDELRRKMDHAESEIRQLRDLLERTK